LDHIHIKRLEEFYIADNYSFWRVFEVHWEIKTSVKVVAIVD